MLKVRDSHLHDLLSKSRQAVSPRRARGPNGVQVSVATNTPSRRPDVLRESDMPFLRRLVLGNACRIKRKIVLLATT